MQSSCISGMAVSRRGLRAAPRFEGIGLQRNGAPSAIRVRGGFFCLFVFLFPQAPGADVRPLGLSLPSVAPAHGRRPAVAGLFFCSLRCWARTSVRLAYRFLWLLRRMGADPLLRVCLFCSLRRRARTSVRLGLSLPLVAPAHGRRPAVAGLFVLFPQAPGADVRPLGLSLPSVAPAHGRRPAVAGLFFCSLRRRARTFVRLAYRFLRSLRRMGADPRLRVCFFVPSGAGRRPAVAGFGRLHGVVIRSVCATALSVFPRRTYEKSSMG